MRGIILLGLDRGFDGLLCELELVNLDPKDISLLSLGKQVGE
eukprot:SAG11_NODE_18241_length_496_cov_1.297229_1_plen_42_part_00